MHFVTTTTFLQLASLACLFTTATAYNFPRHHPETEHRTLDEIHTAALKEGGTVTVWHGGDEKTDGDFLKAAFEKRFPGMTLNITVDVSKYIDGNIDRQLEENGLYVDSAILQTLHDYPRWDKEGVLLHYKPLGFEEVYPQFKDGKNGAWTGVYVYGWNIIWNAEVLSDADRPKTFQDFLSPALKDKLVLTYPNDDDAICYAFQLIIDKYGYDWVAKLIAQNPRWVRGTETPRTLINTSNGTYLATFTALGTDKAPIKVSEPTDANFVSWPQTAAIFKDAPHPESAKLLLSYILTKEYQSSANVQWTVRKDVEPPAGKKSIFDTPNTDPTGFKPWMEDRAKVERLKLWFESQIGTAQGPSPLVDGI